MVIRVFLYFGHCEAAMKEAFKRTMESLCGGLWEKMDKMKADAMDLTIH